MKRTGLREVVVGLMVGMTVGYLLQNILVSSGAHLLVPPVSFTITVVIAAITVFSLAWPIRSVLRGTRKRPINALFASRVAMFAKASSLSGGLLTGVAGGLGYFALTRTVPPTTGSGALLIAGILASALLLVCGLLAERFCTLPPDDTDAASDRDA